MTRAEAYQAAKMRIDGATWEKIGRELNYNPSTISHQLGTIISCGRMRRYVYPKVEDAIGSGYGSLKRFSGELPYTYSYLYRVLSGQQKMTDRMADDIAAVTGLTREEVLYRE